MASDCETACKQFFKACCPAKVVCYSHKPKPKLRYIQPPPPQSFKPIRKYQEPEHPLEAESIYLKSYRHYEGDSRGCRPEAIVAKSNMTFANEPLSSDTTMGLSYLGPYQPPPKPIVPARRPLMTGPLQSMTTNRHDFTPKPSTREKPIIQQGNIIPSDEKMEAKSIMMNSFLSYEFQSPPQSFKPDRKYCPPEHPFAGKTVQQLSYEQNEIPPREIYPWMKKPKYERSDHKMDDSTIYDGSYRPPGQFEPISESVCVDYENLPCCTCDCKCATDDLN